MAAIHLDAAAPDFTAPDYRGVDFTLSDLRDTSRVLLVFNRGFF